jgi:NAD(P)-dependent dehydrogenase (short-subunit alcohol dehydrogenase family)
MATDLTDKVALITGASRGMGAAIAERLAARNAKVVINYANSPDAAIALHDRTAIQLSALVGRLRVACLTFQVGGRE